MRPLHYIIVLLMSSALTCTKKVVINMDAIHKRLVIYGFVAAGENFRVRVERTTRYNLTDDIQRRDALVLLYSNNELLDTLRYNDSSKQFFTTKVVAEVNRPYTLKVSAPGYPSVEATDMAPVLPVTESLEHRVKSRQGPAGQDRDEIIFSFRDPAMIKNYYLVALHTGYFSNFRYCVYSTDPAIERTSTQLLPFDNDCIQTDAIFLPDKSFDGELKSITVSGDSWFFDPDGVGHNRKYYPYMKRSAISEACYNYIKYTNAIANREELPFFTESTDSRGNVKEGYGLFTIYDMRVDTIR